MYMRQAAFTVATDTVSLHILIAGLTCYCNDTVSANFQVDQCGEDYKCTTLPGGVCLTKNYTNIETGALEMQHSCLNHDKPRGEVQRLLCGGVLDSDTVKRTCCDSGDFCNADTPQLEILPQPTPSATIPGLFPFHSQDTAFLFVIYEAEW